MEELLQSPALPFRWRQYISLLCNSLCGGEKRCPGCRDHGGPSRTHHPPPELSGVVPDVGEITRDPRKNSCLYKVQAHTHLILPIQYCGRMNMCCHGGPGGGFPPEMPVPGPQETPYQSFSGPLSDGLDPFQALLPS